MPARAFARLATATVALLMLALLPGQVLAQDRWAAIAPNLENSSSVVWATSKDQAKKLAVLACKQVSSTCADTPASTNGMDHIFAVMCCTDPKNGLRRGRRRQPRGGAARRSRGCSRMGVTPSAA